MGVCALKQKNNKSCEHITKSLQTHQNSMITQDKQTTTFYHSTKIHERIQPKEYDYSNPHRQYNVLLNGVIFAVVNSVEGSLNDEPIDYDI